jgi:hypothetical protein
MSDTKKGLFAGGKFNHRHSTVIEAAESFLVKAKKLDSVSKISLGAIERCAPGKRRIKFVQERTAIRVQIRGVNDVQFFYMYGPDLNVLLNDLNTLEVML